MCVRVRVSMYFFAHAEANKRTNQMEFGRSDVGGATNRFLGKYRNEIVRLGGRLVD